MSDPKLRQPGALGEAFGLGGKLAPRRPGPATGAPARPAPEPPPGDVDQAPPAAPPAPPPAQPPTPPQARPVERQETRPQARQRAELVEDEATFQVSAYVLPDVVRALEAARRRTGRTNAELVYDALDAVHDRLPELVAARQAGGARPADSLFPGRRSRTPRAAAAVDGRRRLWSLQATAAELDVLDGLVDGAGARSRSEVISCAVEAVYAPRGRRRAR